MIQLSRSAASLLTAVVMLLPPGVADEIRVAPRNSADDSQTRQTQTQSQSQSRKAVVVKTDEGGEDQRIEIEIERSQQTQNGEPQASGSANILIIGPNGRQEFRFPLDATLNADDAESFRKLSAQIPEEIRQRPEILSLLQSLQGAVPSDADERQEAVAESRLALGIQCEPPSSALRKHLRLRDAGVLITSVVPGSPAAEADLRPDDLLLRVGDSTVTDLPTLTALIAASEGNEIQLTLLRDGEERVLAATPRMMQMRASISAEDTAVATPLLNGLQILPEIRRQLGESGIIVEEMPRQPGSGRIGRRLQLRLPSENGQADALDSPDLQQTMKQLQEQMQELREELQRLQAERTAQPNDK